MRCAGCIIDAIDTSGVYTFDQGMPCFHEVGPPPAESLQRLTAQIVRRVYRRLVADGWLVEDELQPWLDLEETDALDALRAASIRYRVALGPGTGRRTTTLVDPSLTRPETVKPFTVNQHGYSLNAAVACPADRRDRLERLCRYVTRPAFALERLSLNRRGEVLLALKRPFRDGTTHLRFTPEDFMARLAALVPRPRANLTRYHGVFAPAHPWRSSVTGTRRESEKLRGHPPRIANKFSSLCTTTTWVSTQSHTQSRSSSLRYSQSVSRTRTGQ